MFLTSLTMPVSPYRDANASVRSALPQACPIMQSTKCGLAIAYPFMYVHPLNEAREPRFRPRLLEPAHEHQRSVFVLSM